MSRTSRSNVVLLVAGLALTAGVSRNSLASPPLPLKLVRDIPVDQPTTRFDYATVDPKAGLLFVADLAGSRVLVFDTHAERLVKTINDIQSVHGTLAIPDLGRTYASATGVDQVVAIDEATLRITARTPGGHYPDGIAWDPRERKIYVSDEHGESVSAIDTSTEKLVKKIPVGGDVGNTQYDSADGLIYTNVQTRGQLVGINPRTDTIVSREHLPGCQGNHGLLINSPRRLAYIACEGNAKLVTYSLQRHAIIDRQPIGQDPDVLALDPGKSWLYVAGESGVVSIFDVMADLPVKIGEGFLADNAHTLAVDAATHRVFLPLRNVAGQPVLRVMEPE